MAENKTKATSVGPAGYISAIADESRRRDCEALLTLMSKASGHPAVMWGTGIVGFGRYRYPLASGKMGEICAVGFSSRAKDISIYGVAGTAGAEALIARLGKHKLGKGCLYVSRLEDVDGAVLETLVSRAVAAKHS